MLLLPLHLSLLVAGALACFASGALAWPRRRQPGGSTLLLLLLAIAVWQLGSALGLASITMDSKRRWAEVQYLGIATVSPLWLHFVQRYEGVPEAARRRWMTASLLVAALTIAAAVTSAHHRLLWSSITLVETADGPRAVFTHGPLFWVAAAFSYLLVIRATLLLARSPRDGTRALVRQRRLLLFGGVVPWIANLLYLGGLLHSWVGDPTPLALALTGVCAAIAIGDMGLLELSPAKRWRTGRE